MVAVVGRTKSKSNPKPSLTVHQVVAYNFRRAREQMGWTQSQTSEALEPFLGYRMVAQLVPNKAQPMAELSAQHWTVDLLICSAR